MLFQKHTAISAFLKNIDSDFSPGGSLLADPVSGPIIFIFICFNCVLGTCFDVSKCSPYIYPPIKNSDSVLFPGGNLLAEPVSGPIVLLMFKVYSSNVF